MPFICNQDNEAMILVLSTIQIYRTLARWHRKLAKHGLYFCTTPTAKMLMPPFFCDNPDALEALERYGIAHIQNLRVELMYNYLHQKPSTMVDLMMTVMISTMKK